MRYENMFPEYVTTTAVILFVMALAVMLYLFLKDFLTVLFSKTVTTTATLISKSAQPYATQRSFIGQRGSVDAMVAEKGTDYFLYFELTNGKTIALSVPKDTYDVALENASGELSYKGKRFISFTGATDGTRKRDDINHNSFVSLKDNF